MSNTFNLYGNYYDLIYQDKNYEAETAYLKNLISKHAPLARTIIEFGSGTGKHAKLLNEAGYEITGVEPSEKMLQVAQKFTKQHLNFEKGDLQSYKSNKKHDVALALFHVVSYINSNADLITSFKNLLELLKPNALFIFDVWYSPAVLTQLPETRLKKIENEYFEVTRKASPSIRWNENVVEVAYDINIVDKTNKEIQTFTELHCMRHFSLPELKLIIESSGFAFVAAEEFLTGNSVGPDTWGVTMIIKKK